MGHYPRNCKGKKGSNTSKSTRVHDKQNKESSKVKTGSKDTAEPK